MENSSNKKKKILNSSLVCIVTGGSFFLGWFWSDIFKSEDSIEKFQIEQALTKDEEEANLNKINYLYSYLKNNHINAENLDYQKMWEKAFESLVAQTDGGLTRYVPPVKSSIVDKQINGDYEGNGITIDTNKNNETIIDSVDNNSSNSENVSAGDKIIAINGIETKNLSQSEQQDLLSQDGEVVITIKRGNETITQTIYNEVIKIPSTVNSQQVNKNTYLIQITVFNERTIDDFKEAMDKLPKNTRIIFDLRDNGGGLLEAYKEVLSFLIDKEEVIYYESSKKENKAIKLKPSIKTHYDIKDIVVLTNHNTASASELLASNLRDILGAKIVGTKTYGKASIQTVIDLSDGSYLYITDKQYLTAKKQSVDGVGLTPDINEVDNALHIGKALEVLK